MCKMTVHIAQNGNFECDKNFQFTMWSLMSLNFEKVQESLIILGSFSRALQQKRQNIVMYANITHLKLI